MSTVANDTRSMALFCDFENVALGVEEARYERFDITLVLERLLLKGSITVKKAYCDWDRYKAFKAPMHQASFELIEVPHVRQSGKNSADIRMVVDALDLCYTKAHVDTFVIISGDSDFSPLVSKLRENNKTVIGVGVKKSTSDLLMANCDEFIFYDDLVRERAPGSAGRRRAAVKRAARGGIEAEKGRVVEVDRSRSTEGEKSRAAETDKSRSAEGDKSRPPENDKSRAVEVDRPGRAAGGKKPRPVSAGRKKSGDAAPPSSAALDAAARADLGTPPAFSGTRSSDSAVADPPDALVPVPIDPRADVSNDPAAVDPALSSGRAAIADDGRLAERLAVALEDIVDTYEALQAERGEDERIWGSMVKQTLKRRKPGFSESYYGFRSFNGLLEEAQARGLLRLEQDGKSGGYLVRSID